MKAMELPELTISKLELRREVIDMLKMFFPLWAGVAITILLGWTVNLVDNLMLGSYNDIAMAGVTVANQYFTVLMDTMFGVGAGIAVLGAQYWGKRDFEHVRKTTASGMWVGIAFGAVFCIVGLIWPYGVARLFAEDEAIIEQAVVYLRLNCWTYMFYGGTTALNYALRSVQTTIVGMAFSVSTIILNVILNYCLIYGNFGFPELGVKGAAIATLFSRCVEVAIILVYLLKIDKKICMRPRDFITIDPQNLKKYITVATPLIIAEVLWAIGMAVQSVVLGHINATVIIAFGISNAIYQVLSAVGMACSSASSVTIGKTIGRGRYDLVKPFARTLQVVYVLIGLALCFIMLIIKPILLSFYVLTPEAYEMTSQFIIALSIIIIPAVYQFPTSSGIVAGGGDTKYPAFVDNICMWCIMLPITILSAYVFCWPPLVTFICTRIDQVVKVIPNSIKCNRFRFVRDLTEPEGE